MATPPEPKGSRRALAVSLLLAVAVGLLAWGLQATWLAWDHGPPESDEWHHLTKAAFYWKGWERSGWAGLVYHVRAMRTAFPPLVHLGALPFFWLEGGFTVDAAALSLGPWGLLLVLATWGIGREVDGPWTGLAAAVCVAGYPLVVSLSRKFLLDLTLTALVACTLWALVRSRNLQRPWLAWLAGLLFGLALLAKFIAGVFLVGAWAWMMLPHAGRVVRRWPLVGGGGLLLVVGGLGAHLVYQVWWMKAWLDTGAVGFPPLQQWFCEGNPPRLDVLWHGMLLLSIACAAGACRVRDEGIRGLLAFAAATAAATWLAGTWYIPHLGRVVVGVASFTGEGGMGEGDPLPSTLRGWLYYPWMMGRILPRAWFHLLVAGLVAGSVHGPTRRRLAPLLGTLITCFVIINLSPNKEARYTVALAAPLAVVAVAWLRVLPDLARILVQITVAVSALVLLASWVPVHLGLWDAPLAVIWKDDRVFSSGIHTPTQYRFPDELSIIDVVRTPDFYAVAPLPREMPFNEEELPFGNTGP